MIYGEGNVYERQEGTYTMLGKWEACMYYNQYLYKYNIDFLSNNIYIENKIKEDQQTDILISDEVKTGTFFINEGNITMKTIVDEDNISSTVKYILVNNTNTLVPNPCTRVE